MDTIISELFSTDHSGAHSCPFCFQHYAISYPLPADKVLRHLAFHACCDAMEIAAGELLDQVEAE
jgi:hypothetical protein